MRQAPPSPPRRGGTPYAKLFPLDDDGYSAVVDSPVPDAARDGARRAAAACPAAAISIDTS
jgi:ferredoxin